MILSDAELWMQDILANHHEEALNRVSSLLAEAKPDENGCLNLGGRTRKQLTFRGRRERAYRFVYFVLNQEALGFEEVVRHRCHNGFCVNPEHLTVGSRADNKHDDWAFAAYGVDFDYL